jgi:hypothetical protein
MSEADLQWETKYRNKDHSIRSTGRMADAFDPAEFCAKLNRGAYDGNLFETAQELTLDQLKQVCSILSGRHKQGGIGVAAATPMTKHPSVTSV